MSMRGWLKEFYPTPASKVREEDALDYTIRKWTGLLEENLHRHDMVVDGVTLTDKQTGAPILSVCTSSCALCEFYYDEEEEGCLRCPDEEEEEGCPRCPLVRYGETCCNDNGSGYLKWLGTKDARPMLAALRRVQKRMAAKAEVT